MMYLLCKECTGTDTEYVEPIGVFDSPELAKQHLDDHREWHALDDYWWSYIAPDLEYNINPIPHNPPKESE